jgi:hypothetical protein
MRDGWNEKAKHDINGSWVRVLLFKWKGHRKDGKEH